MYPNSKIILQAINGSKENKLRLVKNLGFKNLNKGIRRLEHLIHTGQCPEPMRGKLPFALGLDLIDIQQAFQATFNQRREEAEDSRRRRDEYERRCFHPHIWIKHELENPPPGSICIVGFVGIEHWKVIQLPEDIGRKPWSEQFRVVRIKIRGHQHREEFNRSIFGGVLGYMYRKTFDDSFLFSIDGLLVEIYSAKVQNPDVNVRVGKGSRTGVNRLTLTVVVPYTLTYRKLQLYKGDIP
jgi:hypothetical protein